MTLCVLNDYKRKEKEKKKLNILVTRTNILVGLLRKSDLQENALKEYYKNGWAPWFDTFMQKMLLKQTTIWTKSLNLLIFDWLKVHIFCIYLPKPLNNLVIMFLAKLG